MSDELDNTKDQDSAPREIKRDEFGRFLECPFPEKHWGPGESGNPAGRKRNAGASIREWLNELQNFTEDELRAILRDRKSPANRKAAAATWLAAMGQPDPADYAGLISGEVSLDKLKKQGVDTSRIKRISSRKTRHGMHVSLELRDDMLNALDRVCDRTDGRPKQAIDLTSGGEAIKQYIAIDPEKV